MRISAPCIITPRLLPGVQIGNDSWISIEFSPIPGREERVRFRYHIDGPDGLEHSGDDLQSGNGGMGADLASGLESLLSFLGAAAESYRYTMGGRTSDNSDLFPPEIMEWAYMHSDELGMLACELQECPDCIAEGGAE